MSTCRMSGPTAVDHHDPVGGGEVLEEVEEGLGPRGPEPAFRERGEERFLRLHMAQRTDRMW
jgi:hypothetical protein